MDELITNLTTIFWFVVIAIAAVLVFWLIQHAYLWTHPKKVSLQMLIAYPEKYHNTPIIITDELVLVSNDIAWKHFGVYSATDQRFTAKLFYGNLTTVHDYVMMKPNSERISIKGKFISNDGYCAKIVAKKIEFLDKK